MILIYKRATNLSTSLHNVLSLIEYNRNQQPLSIYGIDDTIRGARRILPAQDVVARVKMDGPRITARQAESNCEAAFYVYSVR